MLFILRILFILIIIIRINNSYAMNIGAIFEGPDYEAQVAFRVAIDIANSDNPVPNSTFSSLIASIEPEDIVDQNRMVIGMTWDRPFEALNVACSSINMGVIGILGPLSEDNANAVQSVCDAKEVPFIRTSSGQEKERECCSINLYPGTSLLAKAFADLVRELNWKNFTVMYDSHHSFAMISQILQIYNNTRHIYTLEELQKSEFGDYRDILKKIRKTGQTNFILRCKSENLEEILQQIQQVGLMRRKSNFIIVNVDMHTFDLSFYQHSETQFIGLQLVDPDNPSVLRVAKAMYLKYEELGLQPKTSNINKAAWSLDVGTALVVDAVLLFAKALKDVEDIDVNPLSCNSADSWKHGSTLLNFMKMKTIDGLTGLVQFDHQGYRNDVSLNVIELSEIGIKKIGTWNSKEGLNITNIYSSQHGLYKRNSLKNESINVMIAWSEPYALYKNESKLLKGNDQYEGFVVDLIHEISLLEGFKYTLLRNPDDRNGDYNETTKSWNGMIGEILNGVGDIAIGDLTITRQRQEVVDFTTPFMNTGIQILYKQPSKATPLFFSFATPFVPMVWLLIAISYFLTSLALYIMARFCTQEWDNWDPCIQQPKYYFNQFNVKNSLWYMWGCLVQEGANIAPRAASTRILSGVWAFFILVIVSYYKAQLAASLTVDVFEIPFKNVEDLVNRADQLGLRYGAVENEAVHSFFKQSPVPLHQKIADYMNNHPENMVYDNYEGYLLIEEGNYAFFSDSVFIQFVTTAVCYLTAIGDPISEQNLAIATTKGSPYRAPLSRAILRLLESGKIQELQKKWWENDKFKLLDCKGNQASAVAPPLNYHHVSGMFWITFAGIFLACFVAFIELAIYIFYKGKRNYKEFMIEYKKELRFYFAFRNTIKPMKDGNISIEKKIETPHDFAT